MSKPYTIHEHQHRFAAWAASRAAMRGHVRFNVKDGFTMLTAAGLSAKFTSTEIPATTSAFDRRHRVWRKKVKQAFTKRSGSKTMQDGQAAKLINVYLKARFGMGPEKGESTFSHHHPPIDGFLLKGLAAKDKANRETWREYAKKGWSKLSYGEYEDAIKQIRKFCGKKGLWSVEKYWTAYK